MCDHHIRGAGVNGVLACVSRRVAGPADKGFLASRDIDTERFGSIQLGLVVAGVVLGHDRGKRLSCLRNDPVRGVIENVSPQAISGVPSPGSGVRVSTSSSPPTK